MADLATLRTRLAEAEAARHKALTTGQMVDVWRDGRRIKFAPQDPSDMNQYIAELIGEIVRLDPTGPEAMANTGRRRAIGVRF